MITGVEKIEADLAERADFPESFTGEEVMTLIDGTAAVICMLAQHALAADEAERDAFVMKVEELSFWTAHEGHDLFGRVAHRLVELFEATSTKRFV